VWVKSPVALQMGQTKDLRHLACHQAGDVLQLVAPVLGFGFSIGVAELADFSGVIVLSNINLGLIL
jgi:hypothetical protein